MPLLVNENWPVPLPGDIINFWYIWKSEFLNGLKISEKPRPCVVYAVRKASGKSIVYVMPITSNPQDMYDKRYYMRIEERHRLMCGLSKECGVVYNETNMFIWPTELVEIIRNSSPPSYEFKSDLPGFLKLKELVIPLLDEIFIVPRLVGK